MSELFKSMRAAHKKQVELLGIKGTEKTNRSIDETISKMNAYFELMERYSKDETFANLVDIHIPDAGKYLNFLFKAITEPGKLKDVWENHPYKDQILKLIPYNNIRKENKTIITWR